LILVLKSEGKIPTSDFLERWGSVQSYKEDVILRNNINQALGDAHFKKLRDDKNLKERRKRLKDWQLPDRFPYHISLETSARCRIIFRKSRAGFIFFLKKTAYIVSWLLILELVGARELFNLLYGF
jgi:hypothetical protein